MVYAKDQSVPRRTADRGPLRERLWPWCRWIYYTVVVEIDWSKRGDYIWRRHRVRPEWANEAVRDGGAVRLRPDPAGLSGDTIRIIGYSAAAQDILTVILLPGDTDPQERAAGEWWGVNAWTASDRDRRLYVEGA